LASSSAVSFWFSVRCRAAVSLLVIAVFRRASAGCWGSAFSISAARRLASPKSSRAMPCSVAITVIGSRSVRALDAPASAGALSRRAR
jgi:hypothetical protein